MQSKSLNLQGIKTSLIPNSGLFKVEPLLGLMP